ncbi:MAG: hypothetical protein K6T78_15905 [Alicyclobacillus sp.]|nr:hypothetical protein [Alicyclobacillus sp.]
MAVSHVARGLTAALKERRMELKDVDIPYSQAGKSMIKTGQRRIAPDVAPKLAQSVRHPAVVMGIAAEFSGGYGSLWLDGPNLDKHRAAVKERAMVEIQEAMDALMHFRAHTPPEVASDSDRRKLDGFLMEVLDARQWLDFFSAVVCEDYGLDFLSINEKHHARLKSLRLVTE